MRTIEEIHANDADNVIQGSRGRVREDRWSNHHGELVDAGAGNDTVDGVGFAFGGAGDDRLSNGDVLIGGDGNDRLTDAAVLFGGAGDDFMDGNLGASRYIIDPAQFGIDTIREHESLRGEEVFYSYWRGPDAVEFLAGLSPDEVTVVWHPGADGYLHAGESIPLESDDRDVVGFQSIDTRSVQVRLSWGAGKAVTMPIPVNHLAPGKGIEVVRFHDGTVWDVAEIERRAEAAIGSGAASRFGGWHDDVIDGGAGNEHFSGGEGNDSLTGGEGNDLLQGGGGNDTLTDAAGANLLDGGDGDDTLTGGDGAEFIAGGAGNDIIMPSGGADVIAFNKGDGHDIVHPGRGRNKTLSLGWGIVTAALRLFRRDNDLVLEAGPDDSLNFKDWYADPENQSIATLQLIEVEWRAAYPGTAGDADRDAAREAERVRLERIDFEVAMAAFEKMRADNAGQAGWALPDSMIEAPANDTAMAVLGGEMACMYADYRALSRISVTAAHGLLASTSFGTGGFANQGLQDGALGQDPGLRIV